MSAADTIIKLVFGVVEAAIKAGQHVKARAKQVIIKDRRKKQT